MALATFEVIAELPVVVEEGGSSISYPPGAIFTARDNNTSVLRLLNLGSIILVSGVDPRDGFVIIQGPPGPPGAGQAVVVDDFSPPVNGQILFVLSQTPADASAVRFYVNGIEYTQQQGDITVAGTNLTWLDVPFTIEATDGVWAIYEV